MEWNLKLRYSSSQEPQDDSMRRRVRSILVNHKANCGRDVWDFQVKGKYYLLWVWALWKVIPDGWPNHPDHKWCLPNSNVQLEQVQFKGGEERVRAKESREMRSIWLHAWIWVDIMEENKIRMTRKLGAILLFSFSGLFILHIMKQINLRGRSRYLEKA